MAPHKDSLQPVAELRSLELLAGELEREIADVNQRQANALTRASIILAAAGLTLFLPFGSNLQLLQLVSMLLAAGSAGTAIFSIAYWQSRGMKFTKDAVDKYQTAKPEVIAKQLIQDRLVELESVSKDLTKKSKLVVVSLWLLGGSWLLHFAGTIACIQILN